MACLDLFVLFILFDVTIFFGQKITSHGSQKSPYLVALLVCLHFADSNFKSLRDPDHESGFVSIKVTGVPYCLFYFQPIKPSKIKSV